MEMINMNIQSERAFLKTRAQKIAVSMCAPALKEKPQEKDRLLKVLEAEIYEQMQMMPFIQHAMSPVHIENIFTGGKSITVQFDSRNSMNVDLAFNNFDGQYTLYDYESDQPKTVNAAANRDGDMICISWWS